MPFDVFIAPLRCPGCGAVVTEGEIQTRIRGGLADGSALTIGTRLDAVDLERQHLVGAGYALVNEPRAGRPIRLLDVWTCSQCGTEHWAMIEIADGTIRSIEPVELNRKVLDSANYISDENADLLAKELSDQESPMGESSVESLRRRLP
jgi:hypothetical protein